MLNEFLLVGSGFVVGLLLAPIVFTAYSSAMNRIIIWGRKEGLGDE